jgi:adenine-specific DNA-methyltransferase
VEIDDFEFQQVEGTTPNLVTELAQQLAAIAPEALSDGKIDLEKLRELISVDVDASGERYGFYWPGKKRALRVAQNSTTATLSPKKSQSKNWDTTSNVFIEGDNLEVLKVLQKHYHNKVKLIYIDPPYNTGKDFIYPDNFKEGLDSYLDWTQQVGTDGKKLSTNSESDGRFHSNWLNMMYPRLKLARNLLTLDGFIFISIDDHEVAQLRKLCDEVFGEANFAGQFIWKKGGTGKNDSQFAVVEHEYILAYARNAEHAEFALDVDGTVTTSYNLEDEIGKYSLVRLDMQNLQYSPALDYDLTGPDGTIYKLKHKNPERPNAIWRWSKDRVQKDIDQLVFKDGNVYTKNYAKDGAKVRSLLVDERFGVTRTGRAEAEAALGQSGVFDFPKPVRLIQFLVRIATSSEDIVLDFFAGSGTTAQAVLEQNAIDGGSRKFIIVQLPEPTPQDSTAKSLGYENIAEVSRARITGACLKIEAQVTGSHVDTGYRAYSLTDSNFTKWKAANDISQNALEQHLLDLRESSDDSADPDDLLVEILIKQGYSLTENIGKLEIEEMNFKTVGENLILAYLDESRKPKISQFKKALDTKPAKFIILEDVFNGDDELKTNLMQECKSRNIEIWTA